ncbi:transcription termination factor, mitochondrial isoform X1 [Adelges cooleyi]|uniref:transcription termination factor, mitochondrial isoform X1 n=2 Tax=Adelges cooleyi TaxID=133065 RepID=UPI0021801861|nr:transcription termination factor, mitochondrial isoform X1 [Adelges cooleyi]XP_050438098.1 transcription termination factor, mitochondrial isoform X1 [Adelges cooleyi]
MSVYTLTGLLRCVRICPVKYYYCTVSNKRETNRTKLKKDDKENKIKLLVDNGMPQNAVYNNEWLFNIEYNNLKNGFNLLKQWNPEKMEDLYVLLQMPMTKLIYFTKKIADESEITMPYRNRVYFFVDNFKKHPHTVCHHMMQHTFLFTRKFPIMNNIYNILVENKVQKEDIWNDVWVFMYSINQIEQRMALANAANVNIKPWMVRCKNEVFERTVEIKQNNRVVLNKNSTAQYLAKRLHVDEKYIYRISEKYPSMLRVSPTKLKELLDFLLNEGFEPMGILSIPRVFTHSITTLQERLIELRDLGYDPTVAALCKNKTSYQELVDKLILKNTNELKKP